MRKKKMPVDTFAIVNESTEPSLTRDVLLGMCAALQKQSERDFAPEWKQTPSTFILFDSKVPASLDVHTTILKDETPEAPGALAWHTVDENGNPVCVLGVNICKKEAAQTGKTLFNVISSAISHEACETRGDTFANENVDMPDGHHDTPKENCDWTQGDTYTIDGYEMSNFVYLAFFSASAEPGTKLDHMGVCTQPLCVRPSGYAVIRSVKDGRSKMIFGDRVSEETRANKIRAHESAWTRRSYYLARRRGLDACALVNV